MSFLLGVPSQGRKHQCPTEGVISLQELKLLELRWSLHCVYIHTFSSLPFRLPSSSSVLVLTSHTFVVLLYCQSICCPQLQARPWHPQWLRSELCLEKVCVCLFIVSALPRAPSLSVIPCFNTILHPNVFCIQSRWFREEHIWEYLMCSTELQMSAILSTVYPTDPAWNAGHHITWVSLLLLWKLFPPVSFSSQWLKIKPVAW